jgi:hypothetical protein
MLAAVYTILSCLGGEVLARRFSVEGLVDRATGEEEALRGGVCVVVLPIPGWRFASGIAFGCFAISLSCVTRL